MPLERNLHLPSSVSVVNPGYLPDSLTDFIRSLQALNDLTALSRGNSQKRIHFRMIQPPFTASSKQLFTNYSIASYVSGWRKCVVNCVFHTEFSRVKMLIEWLLGSQNMLSFLGRCYCHTRHSWGKSSWLTSAPALAKIKVVEQMQIVLGEILCFLFMARSVIVFVIVSGFI